MFKRAECILVCTALCLSALSGCSWTQSVNLKTKTTNTLTIAYSDRQYGSGWIQALVKSYKKKRPNVKVRLEQYPVLDQRAQGLIESQNAPDILFLPNTNWQTWAKKGELEKLTGLFKTKVNGKKTLEQKIQFGCLVHCKYAGNYWVVPWDDGVQGFVYNKKLFDLL